MKQMKRRLLSLLMAFAILCTMIPAAFAAEGTITWTKEKCADGFESHNPVETSRKNATCTEKGTISYKCGNEGCTATGTETIPALGHDFTQTGYNETQHWEKCSRCDATQNSVQHSLVWKNDSSNHWQECSGCEYKTASEAHAFTLDGGTKCSVCGATRTLEIKLDVSKNPANDVTVELGKTYIFQADATATYGDQKLDVSYAWTLDGKPVTENGDKYTLPSTTSYGNHTVACTVSASANGKTASKEVKWTVKVEQNVLSLSKSSITINGRNDYADLYAIVSGDYDAKDVRWSVDKNGYVELKDNKDGIVRITPLKNGTVTVYAQLPVIGTTYTVACEVTVKGLNTDIVVKSTIFNTNSGYDFDEKDDEGGTSVVDQIWDEIHDFTKGDYDLNYVEFSSPLSYSGKGELSARTGKSYYYNPRSSQEDLSDVTFTPGKDYKGDVSFDFTAYDDGGYTYSGTITFEVKAGATSAGDIIYTAIKDKDVTLDVKDFEEFWEDEYSKGTLDYVTFGSVSSSRGALLDGDGNKLKTSSKCYADPSSKQIDLDEVTFEPKSGFTGTVTIDFTAYGTNNSKKNTELNGALVIAYTKGEPKAISYSITNDKPVTLDGDDFLDNYKDAMGTTAKTLQIQFLDVPTYGTLYYKYNEKTEKGTELTSKNIGTYTFSTSSRASRSLEDVTYVPDSKGRSDTVKFACYTSNGDLCYYGEVTFGATVKDVTVSLTSTSAGVTFNSADFFGASEDMLAVTYLTFGAPSSGTLYKNWTGVTGTKVTTSDKFAYVSAISGYTSLGTVTYVPAAGYSGTVTIPFSAYTSGGTVISGKVSIKVTATATVNFTDVPTTGSQSWAYPYINRLASAGVVGGITPTTYGPKQQVKWGEVLKMVLLGAGHPTQVEGTGANWAANYLTYAYQKGIVSSNKIDLSKPITRLEMAELAAKALGLSAESSIKTGIIGPTDTTNGYVYALYNRGIVGGDSSSGKNLYNPNSTLLRDEMAKIVCGVMDNA